VDDVSATSSGAKSAKLAKLVKMAKSIDLWCLLPYVPLLQEAKDKQRKVCPVNLRGEVCTANNCDSNHPKVCLVADHGKGKIPKAMCALWHMRVPFAGKSQFQGNFTWRRSGPKPPPGSKGNNSNNARPAKPGKYLVKLEMEFRAEELKARIRATNECCKPGGGGSRCPPSHQVVWTALTPDGAIAILKDTIKQLRLPQ
jgi:hypothetical protein